LYLLDGGDQGFQKFVPEALLSMRRTEGTGIDRLHEFFSRPFA
jgi:hypothetical protein